MTIVIPEDTPANPAVDHSNCCEVCAAKVAETHTVLMELKGLEAKLLPVLEGMQKNPMLKMFFK